MEKESSRSQPGVRALERGLDILACFQGVAEPIPLTTIANKVDLSLSTALRILGTLENKGYISRDEATKRYSLGPKLLGLTSAAQKMNSLSMLALPFMQKLNAKYDETITLYVVSNMQRVCIQRVDSSKTLRQVIPIGDILPLNIGAGGKVLTAWLAEKEGFDIESFSPTVSKALLEQIRKSGYATSFNERGDGIYGIAAPVRDSLGEVIAALSLSGPTARFDFSRLSEFAEEIISTARDVSYSLGWHPSYEESRSA